ncbi:MAG: type II secretion system minor pseudopilin GspI [Pseudomonadales bacterium]|jgi:general secretion pathway protein I|nr:type II secretion system minor pseudopilin GspI [Pseudomonadales bacterium]MDG2036427.1 type II secretion system minor pseudopilin GspI [Pseudomonadales bacterium]
MKAIAKQKGFTLIEIMVAVAVLALSGVALLGNIGQATRDLSIISDKAEALQIAEYALNMALVEKTFPDQTNEEEIITHGGREWRVELTVSDTPNEKMRRIDVMVKPVERRARGNQSATILLSGFRGDIF